MFMGSSELVNEVIRIRCAAAVGMASTKLRQKLSIGLFARFFQMSGRRSRRVAVSTGYV
jgi:hypothetical protein